ncbi:MULTISPECIES: restriction endonuclease subunit S [Cytobacillus]|uniref:Restriction endonuclease subunit S n=1 Tax=Cytobacillus kochii TaxID=859143 RepID=A0A248TFP4_9BACI|nr:MULTISPECIES: restriction endonuclease subunit S [Cytobacillus]ASV67005.1 restriction endonuclease subunit S [Cytobacillus kochii]MEA1854624.1 restriction endonuclease subunit S [Cytobacillus sp. OWB-43]
MGNKKVPEIRFKGFNEEWEQCKLDKLAEFSKGSGYSKGDLAKEGKPIILYGRLYTKYESVIESVDTFAIEKGKTIFSNGNEVIVPSSGESSEDIARASFVSKPGIILGGDINIVRPNKDIDHIFLALTISNGKQQKELSKRAQGKSIVHLHNSDLKEVNLIFPKRVEQTRIGNFFKQLDERIALGQQELDTLKQTKQGFLQKMFPKEGETVPEVRFPGFSGEWEECKVNDFSATTLGGGTPKTSINEYWNGDIPWIQSSDVVEHQVSNVLAKKKITKLGLQNSATKLIPENSIAIVTRVGVGKIALMNYSYTTSQDFLSLSNLKVDEWFGVYSLYKLLQKELTKVQGTSIKGITKNELLEKVIIFPNNIEEQTQIGNFFKQLDETIALQQKELDALKETKKAFLQKMFI